MKRLWEILVSLRTTAVLMLILTVLLLLNVAVPQANVVGDEAIDAMANERPLNAFLLQTLGLSHLSTSPVFVSVLALFFANLSAVLVKRTIPTFKRLRANPPSAETVSRWTSSSKSLAAPLPDGFSKSQVTRVLKGYGYRPKRIDERSWWGLKHRTAPLGFLIFHISFFFLCAGGLMIYYTRFVGGVRLVEGQTFDGYVQELVRVPPIGLPAPFPFTVVEVFPTFEGGEPIDLRATLLPAGLSEPVDCWVNHPAKWGSLSVLVTEAGLAPEVWVQDADGYTIDRVSVAAPSRSDQALTLPIAEGDLELTIKPLVPVERFPMRADLPSTQVEITLRRDGDELYSGRLRLGESGGTDDHRVVLNGMRYWAGFMLVDERGGWVLIVGFTLGVVGAIWRLLTNRREVVITWDDELVRLAGRGEFFPGQFAEELAVIRDTLVGDRSSTAARSSTSTEAT